MLVVLSHIGGDNGVAQRDKQLSTQTPQDLETSWGESVTARAVRPEQIFIHTLSCSLCK